MIKHFFKCASIVVIFVFLSGCADNQDDLSWLIGKWEVSYTTTGDKDWLEFQDNGIVEVTADDVQGFNMNYSFSPSESRIEFTQNGKTGSFHADVKENNSELHIGISGKKAIYTKM